MSGHKSINAHGTYQASGNITISDNTEYIATINTGYCKMLMTVTLFSMIISVFSLICISITNAKLDTATAISKEMGFSIETVITNNRKDMSSTVEKLTHRIEETEKQRNISLMLEKMDTCYDKDCRDKLHIKVFEQLTELQHINTTPGISPEISSEISSEISPNS